MVIATHVKDLGWLDSWSSCFSYLVRQNSKHPLSPVAPHSTFTITCTTNHNTSLSRHWHTSCQLANQNRCSAFQYHINTQISQPNLCFKHHLHSLASHIAVSCTANWRFILFLVLPSPTQSHPTVHSFCSLCYHRLHNHSQPYIHFVPCYHHLHKQFKWIILTIQPPGKCFTSK